MDRAILILMACLFLFGCAGKIDKKLIGTWKSNREKTVSECLRRAPYRQEMQLEKKEKFADIFGHMVHTFTNNELIVKYKEDVFSTPYEIVERGRNYVVIKMNDNCVVDEIMKIRFDENFDSYWVNEDTTTPENFVKIK